MRTVVIDDEPWFVGKDVADALGYTNPRKALDDHVDPEDKMQGDGVTIRDSIGREQHPTIINESGLYSLILGSKLPTAKQFKRWVTNEVLPSIRKNGGYIQGQEELSDEELFAKAIIVAQKTLAEREARIAALQNENAQLTEKNEEYKHKAEYFDALVDRELNTSFRTTANEFGIRQKVFINWLLEHKYVYREPGGTLLPYARHLEDGLFVVKECKSERNKWAGNQTLITPKGRETFRLLCDNL